MEKLSCEFRETQMNGVRVFRAFGAAFFPDLRLSAKICG
jgi:hypothetical protein